MEAHPHHTDWSHIQIFLAVAETGSLSCAGKKLGISQPTAGRQLKAAETALGIALFQRHARGLKLTEAGEKLLPSAQNMHEFAAKFSIKATGEVQAVSGTVRITASEIVSHFVLPDIVAKLRQNHPQIALEIAPTDTSQNLLYREADIAIRMYEPKQLDVIAKHICDTEMGLFASKDYIARRGIPQTQEELMNHDFVGFDRSELIIENMRQFGWPVDRHFFKTRCDDQPAYWHFVRAGCGIGASQIAVAQKDADMVQLLPQLPLQSLPVWLAAHEGLRRQPAIRLVWRFLAKELKASLTV